MIRRIFGIIAATALLSLVSIESQAASVSMCKRVDAGKASGPSQWTARGSQTRYTVDNRGCAVISSADVSDALSSGFISDRTLRADVYTGLSITNSPLQFTLPAGTFIAYLVARETSGGAVTARGLRVGTTTSLGDVISGWVVGASTITVANDVSLLKRAFSATVAQVLYVTSVEATGIQPSSVDITVVYGYF